VSCLDGLLPKHISAEFKTFFDKSKACSGRFENSSRFTQTGSKRFSFAALKFIIQKRFNDCSK